MTLALGLRAFTGWAVAITLSDGGETPLVLDRRRIQLQAPELPAQAYHIAAGLQGPAGVALIAQALEASLAAAADALATLTAAFPGLAAAGLVAGRRPPAPPPRHARMSHTGWHASEGEMYRYTLMRAVEEAGLNVVAVPQAELEEAASAILGLSRDDLTRRLLGMGATIGPPWTQREKSAALAGWLALPGPKPATQPL